MDSPVLPRSFVETAIEVANGNADFLENDLSKAAATVRRALQLAGPESDSALAGLLRAQLALYRAGSPFRDTVKGN